MYLFPEVDGVREGPDWSVWIWPVAVMQSVKMAWVRVGVVADALKMKWGVV